MAALQQWRRRHGVTWVSELLRADGRTLKDRFGHDLQRRIDSCEDDALRLCSIAFGSGLKFPSVRPKVGRMLRAAWDGIRAGDYIWHGGVLCAVRQLRSSTVLLTTYGCLEGTVANRDTQHCFEAGGEGEISYDAQLVMVGNVRESGSGKVYVAGDELLVVRAAESDTATGGEATPTLQPDHPCKNGIPSTGTPDRSCVTSAHETLPWGSHYLNLVAAPGHAWVAFALEHVPQVREAATRAQAAAEVQDHDDNDTDGNIPVLDAYPSVFKWRHENDTEAVPEMRRLCLACNCATAPSRTNKARKRDRNVLLAPPPRSSTYPGRLVGVGRDDRPPQ